MGETTYEIHPAIGIARIGSSDDSSEGGWFLGPEPSVPPPATYRDGTGRLKRQAARFRVFACERGRDGELLDFRELTLDQVRKLTWTVHLANRKGVARRRFGSGPGFRNRATGDPEADRSLIIDPGPRTISAPGDRRVFDSGRFRAAPVTLGEIGMDAAGRLLVLGGYGRSGSDPPQPRLTIDRAHFADNDHWYDDTSDGPVTATIEGLDGAIVECRAWVVVGPPDFAPGIKNLVTLYDLIFDLAVRRGLLTAPTDRPGPVSFARHVRPILERAVGYGWVNRWARFGESGKPPGVGFGAGRDPRRFWKAMADASPGAEPLRRRVVDRLRNPDRRGRQPETDAWNLMPRITDSLARRSDPGNVLPLTRVQYEIMKAWAEGRFVDDAETFGSIEGASPDALDRLALEACVGGPLYPGIEAGDSILGDASRYEEGGAFRLSHAAVRPGEVTQANAVPWQADFLACRWEETSGVRLRRLAWWPAQRPDDVFPFKGAAEMSPWDRGLGEDFQDMVDKWDRLGFVVDVGTPGSPDFVETERDVEGLGP